MLLAVLSSLGIGQAAHAAAVTELYVCDEGQHLVVRESGSSASVEFIDRRYEMSRKRSSIGRKYISPTAALIIDGASAVFVAQDRLQLGQCIVARNLASAK